MTWEQLKEKHALRIAGLKPSGQKHHLKGFNQLEAAFKRIYPEVIDYPDILVNMSHRILTGSFLKELRPHITSTGLEKLLDLRNLINNHSYFEENETNRDTSKMSFERRDVTLCFCKWLIAAGWKNVKPDYRLQTSIDLTAEKDNEQLVAVAFASLLPFRFADDSVNSKVHINENDIKARIGRILFCLIDEKIKDSAITPVMLIADDPATIGATCKYFPFLKNTGITLFKIKSKHCVAKI